MSNAESLRRRRQLSAASKDDRHGLIDALAIAAAGGDNQAAEDLAWTVREFRLAHPGLRQYLMSDSDLDSGEQRVLIAVAYRIGSFRGESRFTTWLYRVAMNEAKMVLRSEQRHSDRAEPDDSDDFAENFVERVSSMVVDRAVVRAEIDRIDEPKREALILREDQGLNYDEIAERLEVPVGTAKTWVRRARGELADRLADRFRNPE